MKEDVLNAVLNYVETDHTGALLINGKWGCGKTYYITHNIFDELKKNGKRPIIISLFGMNSLEELPKKIMNATLLPPPKEKNSKFRMMAKSVKDAKTPLKNLIDLIPGVKDYVKFLPSIDVSALAMSFIGTETIIFLDDLERLVDKIDVNEILGVVNDLVENKRLKVILVANESFLKERRCEATEDSTIEKEPKLIFKEKVIEKTVSFEPDILSIFEELVKEKNDDDFSKIMLTDIIIKDIINPALVEGNDDLKDSLYNIRILRFTVSHFYRIYKDLSDNSEFNLWNFANTASYLWALVVGCSIEYKMNHIEYNNRRRLDDYIEFGASAKVAFLKDYSPFVADDFAEKFYTNYFKRHGLKYFFSGDVFNYITTWSAITPRNVAEKLRPLVDTSFLATTLQKNLNLVQGYSALPSQKLQKVLDDIKNAFYNNECTKLNEVFSCRFYLTYFSDNSTECDKINAKALEESKRLLQGATITQSDIDDISRNVHYQPAAKDFFERVVQLAKNRLSEYIRSENAQVLQLFNSNFADFADSIVGMDSIYETKIEESILSEISKENIVQFVNNFDNKDTNCFLKFFEKRCTLETTNNQSITTKEYGFWKEVLDGFRSRIKTGNTPTNIIIKKIIIPQLEKQLVNVDEFMKKHQNS